MRKPMYPNKLMYIKHPSYEKTISFNYFRC